MHSQPRFPFGNESFRNQKVKSDENWGDRDLSPSSAVPTSPGEGLDSIPKEHLHQRFWHRYFTSFSFFCFNLFLQDPFPVTGFAWKPATLPSSKMQGEEQSRFSGSWGTCDPQTWMRATSPEQTGLPTAAQPLSHIGPKLAGTNCRVNVPRCNKPKYALFHTSMTQGWIATLKEGLDIPAARFRLPKSNKAEFKIAALSCTLWGNSKANHFNLFWTDSKFKNHQVQ